MWDKLVSPLPVKHRQRHGEYDAHSHNDLMSYGFEQHSANLLFQNAPEPNLSLSQSTPPSPSKSGRVGIFKRRAMGHDSRRAPSPKTAMRLPIGLLEKAKSTFGTYANGSQISLGPGPSSSSDKSQVGQFENDVEAMTLRAEEKPPRLPSVLCDPNDSSSLWQTVVYSMAALADSDSKGVSSATALEHDPPCPSSASSSPMSVDSAPVSRASSPGTKGRNRAFSDAVFTAHATTYYTPQMISATPPGPAGHAGLIFLLKTQLVLQTELRRQLETDLRARDELVKVLRKKLAEGELAETEQGILLQQCKKKVEELERSYRSLEKEVEGSRQESMQRTIMDEASSESLRLLCCQLAGLEREKESWKCTEETLRKTGERYGETEIKWEREKQELLAGPELQNAGLVAELEKLEHQLKDRHEKPRVLKSELYAGTDDGGARSGRRIAFGKSERLNNATSPAPRALPAGTALSHSTKPTLSTPTPVHRRVASAVQASPASNPEKENVDMLVPV
ncbi:hypothetical protein B0H13DRAFT_2261127 [Mycena leptocephala]|nr:hypothetical protein B0H13DRAFT_2261127 [Mycena leptocephala]